MNYFTIDKYSPSAVRGPWTMEQLIKSKVDGSDYGRGQLEALAATVDNLTELVGKLILYLKPTTEQLNDWLADYNEEILTKEESEQ